ncbi:MAG: 2-hydroxyacid dehydrogenase [Pseudooceanicola nanhaiensis]|jgi:glyoxylate/hydroxypyruvate reductase A|uniref:2-hydroxyacid dehydrogenase n=1 Tax=Pseudooceanicola nanhaiensis TaxID=375761 RepID=UPI004059904F
MIGVATCSRLDIMALFGPVFARIAPGIELRPPGEVTRPEEVDFVLTFLPDAEAFRPYPALRAIFSVGAGTDAILACPSRPDGVPVFRVEEPDQAQQMAGFAAFHVLWHHRGMAHYVACQRKAHWQRNLGGFTPRARRIGILGMGHMGQGIARGLLALGYPVAGYARRPPAAPIEGVAYFAEAARDDFLARTDILINVLPLTPETEGLIDAAFLAKLPAGAALIHLGRGGHLDEDALLSALESGHLSGASLDVFRTEPLPRDHPFWSHPRILVTPHVASVPEFEDVARSVRDRLETLPER